MTDFLDAARLTALAEEAGWGPVRVVPATGSTNADLAELARGGAPHGTVVTTTHQQAGRGRFERVWETPADTCLATSVLVRPRVGLASWGWLSLLVGTAVAEGVHAATGLDARVKWPNDVLIGGRKICGILSEVVATDYGPAAVLGFGLNIALAPDQLPVPTATSIRIEGSDASAADVLGSVLAALAPLYRRFDAGESLAGPYRAHCDTLGRRIRVLLPDSVVEGVAVDVDAFGGLIVEAAGERRTFAAGDVVHLRPGE